MTTNAGVSNRRFMVAGIAVAVGAVAAVIGAYIDWLWWPVYSGLMLTIAAIAILLIGGIAALVGKGVVRTGALLVVATGVGLLLGQNLGPSREDLIGAEGSMTLTLTSPVAATATAPAFCNLVASETEYSISGDPNMRLEMPGNPFVSVSLAKGDRWLVHRGSATPHTDDIMFSIDLTPELLPADGKPSTTAMAADADSTIDATFDNSGGRITFADLTPQSGIDFTGESIDLAGTLTWTCDVVEVP